MKFVEASNCTVKPGLTRENGEVTRRGENLHPKGHCTDPFVVYRDGTYRMVFNHPVWVRRLNRWATAIFGAESTDGLEWGVPFPILQPSSYYEGAPEGAGSTTPMQFETPALFYDERTGMWMLTVLCYWKNKFGERGDHLRTFVSETWDEGYVEYGVPLHDLHGWEAPHRDPNSSTGAEVGGPQEGSLFRYGPFLGQFYLAATYVNGQKPMLGVAVTDGNEWLRMANPIFADHLSDTGVGQPQVALIKGIYHLCWQRRRGARMSVMYSSSKDTITWSEPLEVFSNRDSNWNGRISGPQIVIGKEDQLELFFFGNQLAEPGSSELWIAKAVT